MIKMSDHQKVIGAKVFSIVTVWFKKCCWGLEQTESEKGLEGAVDSFGGCDM